MSDLLPFDPAPRPGEVPAIVARARRRKSLRAVVPLSAAVVLGLAASLAGTSTPREDQRIEVADDPLTTATETARPDVTLSAPPGLRQPVPTPSGVALLPPVGSSPTTSRTEPPRATRSPRPGERPAYRGELGPRVEEYGYPACRRSQLDPGSRTVLHAGFCIQPTYRAPSASGPSDLAPALRLCWQSESLYNGLLDYATQEEADFSLYDAAGRRLYRFSDTVAYQTEPHTRRVLQGDCYLWQGRVDFDRARHGAGRYTLRLETKTTTFDPAYRVFDILFSA